MSDLHDVSIAHIPLEPRPPFDWSHAMPWIRVAAVALVVGLAAGIYFGIVHNSPSPGEQLTMAWDRFACAPTNNDSERERNLYYFASSVGAIPFPNSDQADAHTVIADASQMISEFQTGTPTNVDATALGTDVDTLFAELGVPMSSTAVHC
jgi:hypothetical protein